MSSISAVIITFNEESNIQECLESLQPVVDEIIVVDSYSKDGTEAICKEHDVQFIQHKFEGHIEQKNFAMSKASHDYVLSLDADERLSKDVQDSIIAIKDELGAFDAYSFNRLNNFCGKWIKHSGWYPDKKTRLWNKSKGGWGGENPHDKVIVKNGKTKHLKGDLLHYTFRSVQQHLKQNDYFSEIAANAAFKNGKRSSVAKIIYKPFFKFLKDFFVKKGFLDGYYGYVISCNMAFANYLKYLKLYELQKKH